MNEYTWHYSTLFRIVDAICLQEHRGAMYE